MEAPIRPDAAHGDGLVHIAVAIVERAKQDTAKGDSAAHAWLAQLRADILELAPPHLLRRVSAQGGAERCAG